MGNIVCKKCNRRYDFTNLKNNKHDCPKHSKKGVIICRHCGYNKGNDICYHKWTLNLFYCFPL